MSEFKLCAECRTKIRCASQRKCDMPVFHGATRDDIAARERALSGGFGEAPSDYGSNDKPSEPSTDQPKLMISTRLQKSLIANLKAIAKIRGVKYQALIRQVLTEYIAETKPAIERRCPACGMDNKTVCYDARCPYEMRAERPTAQSAEGECVTEEGFTQQIHFMQRQSQMLAEQGDDVASRVMTEAAQMVADAWKDRERYRKGMVNWKATAGEKDVLLAQYAAAITAMNQAPQSASVAFSEPEMDNLRSNIIGAITTLWTDEVQRRIVREKVDALFTNAYRYASLRAHFWKPILGACFGRYMIAEEKDARLLDYYVDRATKNPADRNVTP